MSGVDFATKPAAGNSAPAKLRSLRILIVDDNKPFAETLSWVLQGAGDLTEICHNGPSALETARTFDPDIIFLDIILPVVDGYEVCKQLRAQAKRDNLLIVAQSGIDDTEMEAAQRGACFDIHLSKPLDLRQVVSIVNDTRQALKAQESRKD